jgi:serine/threonine protein kinase
LIYDFRNGKPQPHYMLGTPGYAPPEQMSYQIPTSKNDLYSLGALLIFFLTATHPSKIISKDKKETREKLREKRVSDIFIYLVLLCLSRDPMERPTINYIQTTILNEQKKLNKKIHLQTAA